MRLFVLVVFFSLVSIVVLQKDDGQDPAVLSQQDLPPDDRACFRRNNAVREPLNYKWFSVRKAKPKNNEVNLTPQSLTENIQATNTNPRLDDKNNDEVVKTSERSPSSSLSDDNIPQATENIQKVSAEVPNNLLANKDIILERPKNRRQMGYDIPNPLLNSDEDLLATLNYVSLYNDNSPARGNRRNNYASNPAVPRKAHNCEPEESGDNIDGSRRFMHGSDDFESKKDVTDDEDELSKSNKNDEQVDNSLGTELSMRSGWQGNYKGRTESNYGVSSIRKSEEMLKGKVCYACSTANNPRCWAPDRKTTVKYCKKGNNACVTKTFGEGNSFTLIRDCGNSCDESEVSGVVPKFKSCSVCHNDLCNAADSISAYNLIYSILFFGVMKYIC